VDFGENGVDFGESGQVLTPTDETFQWGVGGPSVDFGRFGVDFGGFLSVGFGGSGVEWIRGRSWWISVDGSSVVFCRFGVDPCPGRVLWISVDFGESGVDFGESGVGRVDLE
jgi:hypothetical protein